MPKTIKRVLIIDDQLPMLFEKNHEINELSNTPEIEIHIYVVTGIYDAIEVLESLHASGNKVNLISADNNPYVTTTMRGSTVLHHLLNYCENLGPGFMPEHAAINSEDSCRPCETAIGKSLTFSNKEFRELFRYKKYNTDVSNTSDLMYNIEFRKYCNEFFGTNFALTQANLQLNNGCIQAITPYEANKMLENGEKTIEEVLKLLDTKYSTDRRFFVYGLNQDDPPPSTIEHKFTSGLGKAVSGRLAFCEEDIAALKADAPNTPIILCLEEFSADVVQYFHRVDGVIILGEGNNHLNIIAENLEIALITGACESIEMRDRTLCFNNHGIQLSVGSFLTLNNEYMQEIIYDEDNNEHVIFDGFLGLLYPKHLNIAIDSDEDNETWTHKLAAHADIIRKRHTKLEIHSNADTPDTVSKALDNGAEAIGLVRSEHMFYEPERLTTLRAMFLAENDVDRQAAIAKIEKFQRKDLSKLYEFCSADTNTHITLRLLDAPLDEFLTPEQVTSVIERVGIGNERGIQFAAQTPGLYEAQIRAICTAGHMKELRILVPLVCSAHELISVKDLVEKHAAGKFYKFGAMIETTQAIDDLEAICKEVDFISIGTNDLMSALMGGIERYQIPEITEWMLRNNQGAGNPFKIISPILFETIQDIIVRAKHTNPDIHIAGCGQQWGTDPKGTDHALKLGLDSISVSPQFIMPSRLNAANFALKFEDLINDLNSEPAFKHS